MKYAVERALLNEARVIPIIVRPVDWHETPFAVLQSLPTDGKPVSTWKNEDEAWLNVVEGTKIAIKEVYGL